MEPEGLAEDTTEGDGEKAAGVPEGGLAASERGGGSHDLGEAVAADPFRQLAPPSGDRQVGG
jgi:hypothetical protein